ncbi:MAG: Sir2 family NAD-dependent protein deacetylase [Thermomicrobiales bacterium]
MTSNNLTDNDRGMLDELAGMIVERLPLVAFTGAGVSTESGIPDYRGKNGLWTTGSAKPVTYEEFMEDPERRQAWWEELPSRLENREPVEPNEAHHALVRLERAGYLGATITQNIDGLHRDAGTHPDRLVELHGNTRTVRCTECGTVWPTGEFLDTFGDHDAPPPCPVCGGIVKNGTVAFGQPMPVDELKLAFSIAEETGVMLVVGSTLLVNPAARVPAIAKASGAVLAIVNMGETALDAYADYRLEAPAGATLSYLSSRVLETAPAAAE